MKYNFPKKSVKKNMMIPLEEQIVDKINSIAEENDSTSIGVVETFVNTGISEYEGERDTFVKVQTLVVEDKPKKKYNKPPKKHGDTYCQYAGCMHKDVTYDKDEMIEVEGFLVCSLECEDGVKVNNTHIS